MNDYNFFESYKTKKSHKNQKTIIIFIVFFALLLVSIGGTFLWKYTIQQDIVKLNATLLLPKNQETLTRLADKDQMILKLQDVNKNLTEAPATLAQTNLLNAELIASIVQALPADTQLLDVSFSPTSVNLSGKAALRSAIAEFMHNLRLALNGSKLSLPAIDYADEAYNFAMTITLGGAADESVQ